MYVPQAGDRVTTINGAGVVDRIEDGSALIVHDTWAKGHGPGHKDWWYDLRHLSPPTPTLVPTHKSDIPTKDAFAPAEPKTTRPVKTAKKTPPKAVVKPRKAAVVKPELLREDKSEKPDFTYIAELYPVFARIVKRFQEGAVKYDRLNWRNAEDAQTYRESLLRHNLQYQNGQTDEEHLVATVINGIILLDLEEHGIN